MSIVHMFAYTLLSVTHVTFVKQIDGIFFNIACCLPFLLLSYGHRFQWWRIRSHARIAWYNCQLLLSLAKITKYLCTNVMLIFWRNFFVQILKQNIFRNADNFISLGLFSQTIHAITNFCGSIDTHGWTGSKQRQEEYLQCCWRNSVTCYTAI